MKRRTSFFLASVVSLGLVGSAHAKLSGSGGSVEFTATGPAGLKIVGTTSQITVREDGANVVVTVPLAGLDTGIALRNKHMREKYLEVDKFPTAELTVARSALKVGEGSGTAQGTMKIHGQTRPVSFGYTAAKGGPGLTVEGTVHLDMKAFGIEVPSYMGVTVKPDVDVKAKLGVSDG
ncbi:MAG: YceI family protein [Myxococcales bacterium]|nr:YceI family protein [Myxococcales bacterium]